MKYQFLPHYFKYIGLLLFLTTGLLPNIQSFCDGFYNGYNHSSGIINASPDLGFPLIFFSKTFQILQYIGILLYALAKDKIFDELMIKIRHESLYIVFFGTLLIILIGLSINIDWKMSATDLLENQMILFLIINKIRKKLV